MEKEIKNFIDMMEERLKELGRKAANEEDDLCERLANEDCADELNSIILGVEYKALKALIPSASTSIAKSDGWIKWESDEAPNLPARTVVELEFNSGDFDGGLVTECWVWPNVLAYRIVSQKDKPKKPEKQSLLEFMDEKAGYIGETQTKEQFMRREVYVNISEWMEQQDA